MAWNSNDYKAVSAVFISDNDVARLLDDLELHNVESDRIDVVMSEETQQSYPRFHKENKVPEGTSAGGLTGGLLGAIVGGLTMAGSLLIPGVNLIIAGPIIGILAGGAVGTAAGSLVGALVGLGIPEYEAKAYEKRLSTPGSVLVVAHVSADEVGDVKSVFKKHNPDDISVTPDGTASEAEIISR